MVEGSPTPIYCRVANGAVQRESSLLMVRIGGAVIIRQMTCIAVLRCTCEVSVRMTLTALHGRVRTCQRKLTFRVIEHRPGPSDRRMARRAISGETGLYVIRTRGAVVQRNMASAAIRRCVRERAVRMTLRALHGRMRTD